MNVRVTRAGDAPLTVGEVILLDTLLYYIKLVLVNGGEMPIALSEPD